ncbi:MAG TPA: DNA internalization-related competence protein ComEC/Rec2 [Gemmatimonadaceae bacterium]|nr:DNA internalization-related competence protein ComEC/Rec2 [Gemmatimonadaceae bacterium]
MPLLAFAILGYVAGLLAGFGGFATSLGSLAIGTAGIAGFRRALAVAGVALLFAAGALAGALASRADASCGQRVAQSTVWLVHVQDDAAPGAFVRGLAAGFSCRLMLQLSVQRGHAPAGSVARVMGQPVAGARGLLIQHAIVAQEAAPGWRARARTRALVAIDQVFPADAPLARALLVADMEAIAPEVRDRFAAAGLAHMLSISGLHVGIIALALDVVLLACRVPRRAATLATVLLVAIYVAIIGAPPPAVRSAAMLAAIAASRLAQRPTSPWALLALGAAGPLFAPRTVLDVGYQLSVLGVGSLIASGVLVRRIVPRTLRGWRRAAIASLITSTVATLASAPLVAWSFGRVSLVGPATNLVAAPIMALAQPMLFLGLVIAPLGPLARLVGDAVHPVLAAFDAVARAGAAVPGGWWEVAPTTAGGLLAGIASLALLAACIGEYPMPAVVVGGAALTLLVWRPLTPAGSGLTELHMLDVGQGDAIALRTPHGHWVLFDAGRAWRGGDAGRSVIVPYLARRRGPLDVFVLSHPHTDHVGGAATVIGALHPQRYIDAAYAGNADAYRASLLRAREAHTAWQRVHPADSLVIDGVVITFLAPDSAWTASLDDPNLASTVALVRAGRVRFLLVGDAEAPEEDWLRAHALGQLRADVLKVGHHGSNTSSTAAFLDAVQPRVALISVGAGNSYGHPSAAVVDALAARGAQVLRTDRAGTVIVRTDGARLSIETQGATWDLPGSSN